jgi:hypothetical protein
MLIKLTQLVIVLPLSFLPQLPTPAKCQYHIQRTDPLAYLAKTLIHFKNEADDGELLIMKCLPDTQVPITCLNISLEEGVNSISYILISMILGIEFDKSTTMFLIQFSTS